MTIEQLVQNYEANRAEYLKTEYNETLLRNEFLDPLFQLLEWDVRNASGKPSNQREVILEEGLKADANSNTKKPDYTFRLFSERKFFVEAKKQSVPVHQNDSSARQVRRYGFTAKLKISILSNFEYLIIYDCSIPVEGDDSFQRARIRSYHYSEYIEKIEELKLLIGKNSVYTGEFDRQWQDIEDRINHYSVDKLFLTQINEWRLRLGNEIKINSPEVDIQELNDAVQSYINRLIFLRVCEDRNIEQYKSLLNIADEEQHEVLLAKFIEADNKYNSGLFDQLLSDEIVSNVDSVFWEIIRQLYFPESPYSFAVFGSDVLGQIYEIFLWEKLCINDGDVILKPKPENQDRDIVTTPNFIVSRIVEEVLGKKAQPIPFSDLLSLRIADIACGSGAFLLEAFQQLCDLAIDKLTVENPDVLIPTNIGTFKLPYEIKRELLTTCIFGIDSDYNAVEAAKFGLLLKLLENEEINSLGESLPYLPTLNDNLRWGNSLIESNDVERLSQEDQNTINPFNFGEEKFDVIIGNPPYMSTEHIKKYLPLEKPVYSSKYRSAYKQYDKYFVFTERAISLLGNEGILGYIIPSKLMKVGAGLRLRELLSRNEGGLYSLVSFGAIQVFPNKSTYTCLVFVSASTYTEIEYEEVHNMESWTLKEDNRLYTNSFPKENLESDVWGFYPSSLQGVYEKILNQSVSLTEIAGRGRVTNGIQTSRNSLYIIRPEEIDDTFAYFNIKGENHKVEKELLRSYYETPRRSVEKAKFNTYNYLTPNAFVIFPYRIEGDNVSVIEEPELEDSFPFCHKYFKHYEDAIRSRDVSPPIQEHDWYKFGRSQHLNSWDSEEKLVVGVLSTGDKYVLDNTKAIVSSGGTAGYCIISLPNESHYSIYYIQAILNSKYCEWFAGLYGEVFRGGYIARGTKILEKLPIRTIDFENAEDLAKHNSIAELQKALVDIHSQLSTTTNQRSKVQLQRRFTDLNNNMIAQLSSLYNLADDDLIIPSIQDIYATN